MSHRRFLPIFAVALCATISAARSQVISTPIIPTSATRVYVFPPVGLGGGEIASITVVNTATPPTLATGMAAPQPMPSCSGTISFSNANGAIGTPTSFTVGSEGFKTVTLPFASAGLTGSRGEIQGKLRLIFRVPRPPPVR